MTTINALTQLLQSHRKDLAPLIAHMGAYYCSVASGQAPEAPKTPANVFAPQEICVSLFEFAKHGFDATQQQQENILELMQQDLEPVALFTVMNGWDYARVLLHVNPEHFCDEDLDITMDELAQFPLWTVFFDVADQNLTIEDGSVMAFGVSRHFMTADSLGTEDMPMVQMSTLKGEPKAAFNSLLIASVYDGENMGLTGHLPLMTGETLRERLESMKEIDPNLLDSSVTGLSPEVAKAIHESLYQQNTLVLKSLAHFKRHMHELKDASGSPATLPGLPQPIATAQGLQLIPDSQIREFYL